MVFVVCVDANKLKPNLLLKEASKYSGDISWCWQSEHLEAPHLLSLSLSYLGIMQGFCTEACISDGTQGGYLTWVTAEEWIGFLDGRLRRTEDKGNWKKKISTHSCFELQVIVTRFLGNIGLKADRTSTGSFAFWEYNPLFREEGRLKGDEQLVRRKKQLL